MINENLLKAAYVAKGLTQNDVAKALNITTNTLRSKIKKDTLEVKEMDILIDLLEIKDPLSIFFDNHFT